MFGWSNKVTPTCTTERPNVNATKTITRTTKCTTKRPNGETTNYAIELSNDVLEQWYQHNTNKDNEVHKQADNERDINVHNRAAKRSV